MTGVEPYQHPSWIELANTCRPDELRAQAADCIALMQKPLSREQIDKSM